MLLTHFGLSGPVIINNSRDFQKADVLKVNFSQYDSKETLEHALLKAIERDPKKQVKTLLQVHFLAHRLAPLMMKNLGVEPTITGAELTKQVGKTGQ